MGIIILAKVGELDAKFNADRLGASLKAGPLRSLLWNSPLIAIAFAVYVNIVATGSIVIHITTSKRNIKELLGKTPLNGHYTGVVATLFESALPAAVFGIFAVIFPASGRIGHQEGMGALDMISFSFIITWVAFTVGPRAIHDGRT
jgi:hypothetical protein